MRLQEAKKKKKIAKLIGLNWYISLIPIRIQRTVKTAIKKKKKKRLEQLSTFCHFFPSLFLKFCFIKKSILFWVTILAVLFVVNFTCFCLIDNNLYCRLMLEYYSLPNIPFTKLVSKAKKKRKETVISIDNFPLHLSCLSALSPSSHSIPVSTLFFLSLFFCISNSLVDNGF